MVDLRFDPESRRIELYGRPIPVSAEWIADLVSIGNAGAAAGRRLNQLFRWSSYGNPWPRKGFSPHRIDARDIEPEPEVCPECGRSCECD